MTGKQLKNSILQWAIQGKLVPQDPNDEPASVLLEKIRAEKARLIKEGKIKKDKKESIIYRGEDNSYYEKFADGKVVCIDEEIPFEIPNTWEWCRISHLFVTSSGSTPQSKNPLYYSNGTINWVRTTDLNNGILDSCEIQITPKAVLDYNLSIIPQESICIAMYGGGGTIGKHSIIRFDTTINQSVCAIHPNFVCNMEYVHIFMQYQRPYWMDYAAGSRKDPNINQIIIKNCLIPIPPKKEQDRIVSKYNTLFPLIDNYSEANEQRRKLNDDIASTLKKSILQEAIQGRLVPQCTSDEPAFVLLQRIKEEKLRLAKEGKLKKKDVIDSTIFRGDDNKYFEKKGKDSVCIDDEVPFEIPDAWVWTRLSCVADIYTGNSISETEKRLKFTNVAGRYYIGTKDVDFDNNVMYDNGIAIPKQYEDKFRIAPNHSILMCIEGGSAGRKIAIINKDVCFGNKLCCFSPFVDMGKYIYYYLQSPSFIDMFNDNKIGIIGGVSIAKVKEILIPLPPQREMNRIVAKIDEFVASIMSR
jgi:type I restriction enzyme S subunit